MDLTVALIVGLIFLVATGVGWWLWFFRIRRQLRRDAAIKVDEDHARAIRELAAADYADFVRRRQKNVH